MKIIKVLVTKYQAEDGTLFNDEKSAVEYENFIKGIIVKCPRCDSGLIDPYGDGRTFTKCGMCDGTSKVYASKLDGIKRYPGVSLYESIS